MSAVDAARALDEAVRAAVAGGVRCDDAEHVVRISVKEDLDDEIPFSGLNWQRSGNRPLFQYGQEANES